MRCPIHLSLGFLFLCACQDGEAAGGTPTSGPAAPTPPPAGDTGAPPAGDVAPTAEKYSGPAATAKFTADGLHIVLRAPSLGHAVQRDDIVLAGDVAEVRLTLTAPGPGELAATVMTDLTVDVAPDELGTSQRARVTVSSVQRNVQYVMQPPYLLAAEAARQ